jgi:hypothetical protein
MMGRHLLIEPLYARRYWDDHGYTGVSPSIAVLPMKNITKFLLSGSATDCPVRPLLGGYGILSSNELTFRPTDLYISNMRYEIQARCPECGEVSNIVAEVDIDDLPPSIVECLKHDEPVAMIIEETKPLFEGEGDPPPAGE